MDQASLMRTLGYPGTKASVTSRGFNASPYGAPQAGDITQGGNASYIGSLTNQVKQAQAYDPNALMRAMTESYAPIAHPAYYNTGQAYQNALKQAQGAVDPYYNQQINAFNTIFAGQQQTAQQQQQLTAAGIQEQLANTLQGNEIAQGRVGEDTSTALSNMANAQQNFKETEGMNFDIAQRGLQGQLGQAGTAESGGGQQQVLQGQRQEQLGQQAQGQQYQVQRQAEQLFANRSFEDISRSSGIAKTQAGTQTQQAQLDLNKQLQSIAQAQLQTTSGLEQARKQQEAATAAQYYDIGLSSFLGNLAKSGRSGADISATAGMYRPM